MNKILPSSFLEAIKKREKKLTERERVLCSSLGDFNICQ